jgi:vanillate O-demethylase ferredoxin subunit
MAACAAAAAHWPSGTVHSEHFKAPEQPNRPAGDVETLVEIKSSGQRIEIPPDQSVADALNDAGIAIPTSCLSGLCGTCKIPYLSGEVDHRDVILSDEERAHHFTACVSRPKSGVVLLDI